MSLGAGSLPEELFGICLREDCAVLKMLRRRALRRVAGALSTPSELVAVVDRTLRRIGYVRDVRTSVIEEYARVLQLDTPPRDDVLRALGGTPSQTFEDLLYEGGSPVADALHEAVVALYMQYVDGGDVERLGVADFAAYAATEFFAQSRLSESRAKEILQRLTDMVLET